MRDTQSNNGMHPTADTHLVMLSETCGAAGDAGRYAAGWQKGMYPTLGAGGNNVIAPRSGSGGRCAPHNKRMHATRDTLHVIELNLVGGRVMRGVRLLGYFKCKPETGGWQRRAALLNQMPACQPWAALRIIISGASREARASRTVGARGVRGASTAHPNNGMHPTAGTTVVKYLRGAAAAGDAGRSAARVFEDHDGDSRL